VCLVLRALRAIREVTKIEMIVGLYATVAIAATNLTATSNNGPQTQNDKNEWSWLARTIFLKLGERPMQLPYCFQVAIAS